MGHRSAHEAARADPDQKRSRFSSTRRVAGRRARGRSNVTSSNGPEVRVGRCPAAPLAGEATGKSRCEQAVYKSQSDPDYQKLLGLVQTAVQKAGTFPRRDLKALQPEDRLGALSVQTQ